MDGFLVSVDIKYLNALNQRIIDLEQLNAKLERDKDSLVHQVKRAADLESNEMKLLGRVADLEQSLRRQDENVVVLRKKIETIYQVLGDVHA